MEIQTILSGIHQSLRAHQREGVWASSITCGAGAVVALAQVPSGLGVFGDPRHGNHQTLYVDGPGWAVAPGEAAQVQGVVGERGQVGQLQDDVHLERNKSGETRWVCGCAHVLGGKNCQE